MSDIKVGDWVKIVAWRRYQAGPFAGKMGIVTDVDQTDSELPYTVNLIAGPEYWFHKVERITTQDLKRAKEILEADEPTS